MAAVILALNAGSSSIKFALFDLGFKGKGLPEARVRGSLKDTSSESPQFEASNGHGAVVADESWIGGPSDVAMDRLIDWIEGHLGGARLTAVGHRVVHGGRDFNEPVPIDAGILSQLDAFTALAPLHQPVSLEPVRQLAKSRPQLPQFACFDTAFHHALAPPVSRYPLPRALEHDGIRRYGFHGLSYEAIATKLGALDDGAARERVIVAHLGSGASLCAMVNLRSVDTTMGFTALDGIMMGTRPGALDPGILLYLMRAKGYDADRLERLLYQESGLLGVSGISADVGTLLASSQTDAGEALELFAFLVARHTAALTATLGGLDRFVFTGGIGENASQIRRMVADRLAWLGADLDDRANHDGKADISRPGAKLRLQVIPTDEEAVIAAHVERLLHRA
jgi:acetate kinase